MTDTPASPLRGCIYARESEDRAKDAHNVADQVAAARDHAVPHNVVIAPKVYSDNDVGAYQGKPRKDYEAMMAAVQRGEIQVIIVFHTSRLWRNRRERAEGIEILKKHGVSVWAVKGPSLDMSTAYGRAMAGLLGEFDTLEVEIKAERTALAEEGRAKAGKRNLSGNCGFGWDSHYEVASGGRKNRVLTLNQDEAEAIRDAAWTVLGGGSLMGIVRDWTARGAVPPQAGLTHGEDGNGEKKKKRGTWTPQSVRYVLMNPAIASLRVYKGEEYRGDWPEIISPETWHAMTNLLRDPGRRTSRGALSLLGGIALCGTCDGKVRHGTRKDMDPIYRCFAKKDGGADGLRHVCRQAGPVDDFVTEAVIAAVTDDAGEILKPKGEPADTTRLREDRLVLAARRDEINADFSDGVISRGEWLTMRERITAKIDELDRRLMEASGIHPAASLVSAIDPRAEWARLDISRKRAVISSLFTVTVRHGNRLTPVDKIVQLGPPD